MAFQLRTCYVVAIDMPRLTMVHGLFGTLIICAGFAAYLGTRAPKADASLPISEAASPDSMASARAPETLDQGPADLSDRPATKVIEGDVLEVLDVPEYTYARLGVRGSEGTWAAFPSTKVAVGQHLKLADAFQMTDFASKALNRTFSTIWFGNLSDGSASSPTDNPHTGVTGNMDPEAARMFGAAKGEAIAVHPVDKASGPNGKTVAEIIAGRTALAGKKVRVRAIVVKKTAGVLGHDYLHVRDGSGSEATHDNDLSVTIDAPVSPGDTILVEGKISLDVNIGAGYVFSTLLEGAQIVSP